MPIPQEFKKAAEEALKGRIDDPCSIMCPDEMCHYHATIAVVASLLHSQAQGLVKEMLERVPKGNRSDFGCDCIKAFGELCLGCKHEIGWNSARSALLEWAKSKNLV